MRLRRAWHSSFARACCALLAALGLGAALAACGESGSEPAVPLEIGIVQAADTEALSAAAEGFIAALDDAGLDYSLDRQSAHGDKGLCASIAGAFAEGGYDLIAAVGTPAAQAAAGATDKIPIVCAGVSDYLAAGLLSDAAAPGGNLTGSAAPAPIAEQLALIPQVAAAAETVAILHCTSDPDSGPYAYRAADACVDRGLGYRFFEIADASGIAQTVAAAAEAADVLYVPADSSLGAHMDAIAAAALEHRLPTIVGDEGMVSAGGLISRSRDHFEQGYRAGLLAVSILVDGAAPGELPIAQPAPGEYDIVFNADTARALDLSPSYLRTLR